MWLRFLFEYVWKTKQQAGKLRKKPVSKRKTSQERTSLYCPFHRTLQHPTTYHKLHYAAFIHLLYPSLSKNFHVLNHPFVDGTPKFGASKKIKFSINSELRGFTSGISTWSSFGLSLASKSLRTHKSGTVFLKVWPIKNGRAHQKRVQIWSNRYIIYIYTSKTVTHNHFGKVVLQKSFWGRWSCSTSCETKWKNTCSIMFLNTFSYSSTMTSLDLFSFLLLLLSVACWIKSEFNSWDGQRMPKDFNISMPGRFIHKTSTCLVRLSESDVITMIVISGTTKRNLHISQSCGFHISHMFNISKPQRCKWFWLSCCFHSGPPNCHPKHCPNLSFSSPVTAESCGNDFYQGPFILIKE